MEIQIAVQGYARVPHSLHLWENVNLCQMENPVHTMQTVLVETVTVFFVFEGLPCKTMTCAPPSNLSPQAQ
jgi:hypothetical protein